MNKKQKISIFGMYGAKNIGDEIISFAMKEKLKEIFKTSTIQVLSQDRNYTVEFLEDASIEVVEVNFFNIKFWMNIKKNVKVIKDTDILIVGGGGLFQDQYSFQLPLSSLFVLSIAIINNIPAFVIGTGFGPIRSKVIRKFASQILSKAQLIMLRDKKSYEFYNSISINSDNAFRTADVVPSFDAYDYFKHLYNKDSRIISFILRDWPGINVKDVAKLVSKLIENGYKVKFHCYEYESDSNLANEILKNICNYEESVQIINPKSIKEAYKEITTSSVIISMRYHGCVLGASLGIPLIPVKYEVKVEELAMQLGLLENLIETSELNEETYLEILNLELNVDSTRKEILKNFKELRVKSNMNFTALESHKIKQNVISYKFKSLYKRILFYGFYAYITNFLKSRRRK